MSNNGEKNVHVTMVWCFMSGLFKHKTLSVCSSELILKIFESDWKRVHVTCPLFSTIWVQQSIKTVSKTESICRTRRRLSSRAISEPNYYIDGRRVLFTCFKSTVTVTYWYWSPLCSDGLCHHVPVTLSTMLAGPCVFAGSPDRASQTPHWCCCCAAGPPYLQ